MLWNLVSAGDRSENISEDDDTGQKTDALSTRLELTPAMPAFEQGDLRPPASPDISTTVFSTSRVVREGRNITPDFPLDNMPSLQEQFDRVLHE
jgi:hypothetical protein